MSSRKAKASLAADRPVFTQPPTRSVLPTSDRPFPAAPCTRATVVRPNEAEKGKTSGEDATASAAHDATAPASPASGSAASRSCSSATFVSADIAA